MQQAVAIVCDTPVLHCNRAGTPILFRNANDVVHKHEIDPATIKVIHALPRRRTYHLWQDIIPLLSSRLEELASFVTYEYEVDQIQGAAQEELEDLPSLQRLSLSGYYLRLAGGVLSRLRFLTLSNWPERGPRMSSVEFWSAVSSWTSVEELRLSNFLGVASLNDHPNVELPQLRTLVVVDDQHRVRTFVNCLSLPNCEYARLVGDVSEALANDDDDDGDGDVASYTAMSNAIPRQGPAFVRYLPTEVEVHVCKVFANITVKGYREDKEVEIVLEVRADLSVQNRRAELFEGTVSALPALLLPLDVSRFTSLRFKGPVYSAKVPTYLQTMDAFSGLVHTVEWHGCSGPSGCAEHSPSHSLRSGADLLSGYREGLRLLHGSS